MDPGPRLYTCSIPGLNVKHGLLVHGDLILCGVSDVADRVLFHHPFDKSDRYLQEFHGTILCVGIKAASTSVYLVCV